jgi:dihydrodipicolinate synthase/N-acetylneuraminate lyase
MAKAKSMKDVFKGMLTPIPAVFDGKGEPDLAMIERLTDWYLDAGVNGFFVLGSQGQGAATTIEQRKAIGETVVRRVNGRVPIILQVGAVDPYTSMELAAHAKEIGATAIGLVGPYYYSDRSEWELIEQHKQVDAVADLPMLLYNNPQYSGYPTPPAMMKKLKEEIPKDHGRRLRNLRAYHPDAAWHAGRRERFHRSRRPGDSAGIGRGSDRSDLGRGLSSGSEAAALVAATWRSHGTAAPVRPAHDP